MKSNEGFTILNPFIGQYEYRDCNRDENLKLNEMEKMVTKPSEPILNAYTQMYNRPKDLTPKNESIFFVRSVGDNIVLTG